MRCVLVHGFSQSARSWDAIAACLAARLPHWDAVALDVPDGLDFETTAEALGREGGTGVYVGYSMGGRLCLRLAVDRPDLVERLVLISASPGIARAPDRAARRERDEELALDLERDGLDAFLERWIRQPLFATLDRDAAGLEERRRVNTVARLAHQLRALGQGAQEPLWDRLPELQMPVALLAGALDQRYAELAVEMGERIGTNASVDVVAGTGHALHLELAPDDTAHRITAAGSA